MRLTSREEEVPGLVARGYSNKEIAGRLAVTFETVRDLLRKIYNKLHLHSRTQAATRYVAASDRGRYP